MLGITIDLWSERCGGMSDKIIITIGREFGSGGKELGTRLGEKLGIPVYDKELLNEAAKESGYSKEIFEQHDEKPTNSFLYSLAMGVNTWGQGYHRPLMLELYLAQFDTIKKLADEGSGIFIGRCADYVLADREDAFHIFVHADMKQRIARIVEKYNVSEKKAGEMCMKNDKDRSSYYNYYSSTIWGDSRHYDLTLNTAKFGIEKAVDIVIDCLNNRK